MPLFLVNLALNLWPAYRAGFPGDSASLAFNNSVFWIVWFVMLGVLSWVGGANHPPTDEGEELGTARRAIAIVSLSLFVLLFMSGPFTLH